MDIKEILSRDFSQALITEFGIENESDAAKATLLAKLGESIFGHIVLETLKALPEEKRAGFDALVGTGDPDALKAYVSPHIPDFEAFVREETGKEIARIKTAMG